MSVWPHHGFPCYLSINNNYWGSNVKTQLVGWAASSLKKLWAQFVLPFWKYSMDSSVPPLPLPTTFVRLQLPHCSEACLWHFHFFPNESLFVIWLFSFQKEWPCSASHVYPFLTTAAVPVITMNTTGITTKKATFSTFPAPTIWVYELVPMA